ncbi:serine/threonine protein kinase [Lactiplantibacillus plantarum EGD-AQ4]|nr:serine/threonine protein kinase [Lactiplantibacillus plantarum EGD-AQ4]
MISIDKLSKKGGRRLLPIVQAMQLLSEAGYEPLGPLLPTREFPLLVKKQQVVSVAKIVRADNLPVLQRLKQQPVPRMPQIEALLTRPDCVVSIETLINGQTLADQLRTQGPFFPEMTAQVATELLQTLQALADREIVHRDLKLSNVMCYRDHYYLIDVNAARQHHAAQDADTRLLGTSGFAAPENYGFAQTDQRSDIYSLGVVLNCLLTGQEPHGPLDKASRTADEVWGPIIARATALDPDQRYQSATAMLAAIPGQPTSVSPKSEPDVSKQQGVQVQLAAKWQYHLQRGLVITLWVIYGIMMLALISAGWDQPTVAGKINFWMSGFLIFVAPVIAHSWNRWLKQQWSSKQWSRYRWWLRVAETVAILAGISYLG